MCNPCFRRLRAQVAACSEALKGHVDLLAPELAWFGGLCVVSLFNRFRYKWFGGFTCSELCALVSCKAARLAAAPPRLLLLLDC